MSLRNVPISLIGYPYWVGLPDVWLANGPGTILADDNFPLILAKQGFDVDLSWVSTNDADPEFDDLFTGDQMGRILVQNRKYANLVRNAREHGRFPIAFTGGCTPSVGMVSALAGPDLGIIWVDAHTDSDLPDTTPSGSIEMMPASIVAGDCYRAWANEHTGFEPIPDERWVMVGCHSHEQDDNTTFVGAGGGKPKGAWVNRTAITEAGGMAEALISALGQQAENGTKRVYLHIDTDVLDAGAMSSNDCALTGGLSVSEMLELISTVFEQCQVEALSFDAYDPDFDPRAKEIITQFGLTGAIAAQSCPPHERR